MPFPQNDHMVQAVAPDGSDHPFHIGPLPGAGWSGKDLLNIQASDSLAKLAPIDLVAISQQVTRCGVFRKGLNHLLSCPKSRGTLRDVDVKHPSAMMSPHHQHPQDSKCDGGNGEEVDRDQFGHVLFQEDLPGL